MTPRRHRRLQRHERHADLRAGRDGEGMRLTPEGAPVLESGLSMAWRLRARGSRGSPGGASGFELAFKAVVLWVGAPVDGVDGSGRLKAAEAAETRFRTGLEGSRDYTHAGRLSPRPSVEVGLWHDCVDAASGAGMDGAGWWCRTGRPGWRSTCGCGCWWCTRLRGSASGTLAHSQRRDKRSRANPRTTARRRAPQRYPRACCACPPPPRAAPWPGSRE